MPKPPFETMYAFCVPGNHGGAQLNSEPPYCLPQGWRYVKVQRTNEGKWVYNPLSHAEVLCCPIHHVEGEPGHN
jgi:hypothetical protein